MGHHLTGRGAHRTTHEDVVDLAVGAPRRPRTAHDRPLPARHEHPNERTPCVHVAAKNRVGASRGVEPGSELGPGAVRTEVEVGHVRARHRHPTPVHRHVEDQCGGAAPGHAAAGRRSARASPRRGCRAGRAPRCPTSRARPHATVRAPARRRVVAAPRRSTGAVGQPPTPWGAPTFRWHRAGAGSDDPRRECG